MTPEHAPATQVASEPTSGAAAVGGADRLASSGRLPLVSWAEISSAGEAAEVEAEAAARAITAGRRPPPLRARPRTRRIYRQAAESVGEAGGLIVEDDAPAGDPPRMRKRDFLDALEEAMCRAVEEGFEGSQYEGRGCPMVGEAIGFYRRLPASSLEASIRRYTPEAVTVRSAREYISLLTRRVTTILETFVRTGRVTGIPTELIPLAAMLLLRRAGGVGGLLRAALGGVLGGIGGAVAGVGRAVGGAIRTLFQHRTDPVGPSVHAQSVRVDLGPGARLDGGVRARMERAFGHDFSSVRIHADPRSGAVAEGLGARALTVGRDIAFAPGEYQPGTPVGDAVIAHELAHTIQQDADISTGASARTLEEEADASAASVVGGLWGEGGTRPIRPRRRSGLRLQRCGGGGPARARTPAGRAGAGPPALVPIDRTQWRTNVLAAKDPSLSEDRRRDLMVPLVQRALAMYAGVTVRAAGQSDPNQEALADYEPAPVVNFDVRLNLKRRIRSTDILRDNGGHSFTGNGQRYLVLGPRALDEDNPDATRFVYEHELYHVEHDLAPAAVRAAAAELRAAGSPAERQAIARRQNADAEVEAYADQFPRFFLRLGSIERVPPGNIQAYAGETWREMLIRFGSAGDAVKRRALERLEGFYNGLSASDRHVFDEWLRLRERRDPGLEMVQRLARDLRIDLSIRPRPWP